MSFSDGSFSRSAFSELAWLFDGAPPPPPPPPTGGGAGDYFSHVLNFAERRRRIEEELKDDPTPAAIAAAAQVFTQELPDSVALEAAQARVAALIEQQTQLSAYLQAMVYAEVARVLEARRQDDEAMAVIAIMLAIGH